jgi:nicotinamide riboside kinase
MKVINIFGGPGVGKTVQGLLLTAHLKIEGFNACLVPEYARELVYQNEIELLQNNQEHIFNEQSRRVDMRYGNVDIAVCECPILLNIAYNKIYGSTKPEFDTKVLESHNNPNYTNFNYILHRETEYKNEGRYQDEDGAKNVDLTVIDVIKELNIPHKFMGLDNFVDNVIKDIRDAK